jgi:hypothetical protein
MTRIGTVEDYALLITSLSVAMLLVMVLFIGYFDILSCGWLQEHVFGPLSHFIAGAVVFISNKARGIKERPSTSPPETKVCASLSAQTAVPTNGGVDALLAALGLLPEPNEPKADHEWTYPVSDVELAGWLKQHDPLMWV